MKHRNMFSIALVVGALLSVSFAPATLGQPRGMRRVDTNMVRLGPGQILRLTINGQAGNDNLTVSFRRLYYVGSNNGNIWKGMIASQDTPAPITLSDEEAASIDASQGGFDGVRIEAIIRGFTGPTNIPVALQIMNADGSVAAFFDIFPEVNM